MAVKFQGGKAVQQAPVPFDGRSIVMGNKAAERGLTEMSDGLRRLEKAAQQSGNAELIAFVAQARESVQKAKMNLADVSVGLMRFMR
jgi:polysaccharide deacetylase 2 family uncharacterized protein YibQ